jgi:hypothetical protein
MSPADIGGRAGAHDGDNGESVPRRLAAEPAPPPGSAEALVVAFLRASPPYRTPAGRRERLEAAFSGARRARPVRSLLKPGFALALSVCIAATVSAHLLEWPHWLAERLPGREAPARPRTAAAPVAPPAGVPRASTAQPNQKLLVAPLPPLADAPPPIASPSPIALSTSTPQLDPARRSPTLRRGPRAKAVQASNEPTLAEKPAAGAEASPTPPSGEAQPPAPQAPARADTTKVSSPASTTAEEDAALALAALRALRRDHDPARARAMVEAYLRAHPDSSMAEEALAISIEAAAAHHDADAKGLAARYLALYPSGTFGALARKTLRSDADSQ